MQAGGDGFEPRCMQKVLGIFLQMAAAARGDTYIRGALGGCKAGVIRDISGPIRRPQRGDTEQSPRYTLQSVPGTQHNASLALAANETQHKTLMPGNAMQR